MGLRERAATKQLPEVTIRMAAELGWSGTGGTWGGGGRVGRSYPGLGLHRTDQLCTTKYFEATRTSPAEEC